MGRTEFLCVLGERGGGGQREVHTLELCVGKTPKPESGGCRVQAAIRWNQWLMEEIYFPKELMFVHQQFIRVWAAKYTQSLLDEIFNSY